MQRPANRVLYLAGIVLGLILFFLAWDGFFWLLRELGYVDGSPASTLVSALFLLCMLVMCAGYGVGMAILGAKMIWGRKDRRAA